MWSAPQANLNRGVPADVRCGSLRSKGDSGNASDFPRAWNTKPLGGGGGPGGRGPKRVKRGTAWLFYPCGGNASCLEATSCSCKHTQLGPSSMRCSGADFDSPALQAAHITGKPWAVFVHGGAWSACRI